jgi:hypothetical protein
MTLKKGLIFFDNDKIDTVLKKAEWDNKRLKEEKCQVCNCNLTKNNIGALTHNSPIKGVCRKFPCIMSVLLMEKSRTVMRKTAEWP